MEFKDLIDTILKLVDKIDNLWNLFYLSNLGVIVWILSNKNLLENPVLSIVGTIAYIAYSLFSLFTHIRAYKFLDLVLLEMKARLEVTNFQSELLKMKLKELNYQYRFALVITSYFSAMIIVLYIFWRNH